MKQVIQNARTGDLRVQDVPEPSVKAGCALVRTTTSLISAGTERMVADFARRSLLGKAQARPDLVRKVLDKARRDGIMATLRSVRTKLDEPLPLGYSAAGVIVALGEEMEGEYHVGQRVAMAGAGVANHAEINLVPRNLLATVPHDVDDEAAAFATMSAIAMHGIRNLSCSLGEIVVVIGAGLVGLLAVRLLTLAGVRVVAIDLNAERLTLAGRLGSEACLHLDKDNIRAAVSALSNGRGADGVLITAADDSDRALALAGDVARDRARVSVVGKVGTAFPFADYMKKELSVVVSRSYGPGRYDDEFEHGGAKYPVGFVRWTETDNLRECLRLMSSGRTNRLDTSELISHRFDITEAEKAYGMILDGAAPHLGVLLRYGEGPVVQPRWPAPTPATDAKATLGVIGAGQFARAVLLPELARLPDVQLRAVVTAHGPSSRFAQEKFGFAAAGTDTGAILSDAAIQGVVIATPHGQHASLVAAALSANKSVFVEKPLAVDRAGIEQVRAARSQSKGFFTVGFNRRFAPMTKALLERSASLPGPRVITIRVNAGPVGGAGSDRHGRIVGELCHFVDLARVLARSPVQTVHALTAPHADARAGDDIVASLAFANGSIASLTYTGLGDPADTKERIEVFVAGDIFRIEDFRRFTTIVAGRETTSVDRLGQDKGHRAELAAFVAALSQGRPPIDEAEIVETSLATIALVESLRTGATVNIAGA